MYLKPRIIPCLLLEDGNLVKTVKFSRRTYIGDPINTVKIFNKEEADELCILDISARRNNRIDFKLLEDIATEAFMPLSYGGGIISSEDAKKIFRIGFEKIIVNSSLYLHPDTVREIVDFSGAQSVVASIDFKRSLFGKIECYINCGKKNIKKSVNDYLTDIEKLGVGEILLNSINQDGMMNGYDYSVIKMVTQSTCLPVICIGGAGSLDDMRKAVIEAGAHAVSAGSLFVYYGPRKAVLINYPTEQEQRAAGLFC